MNGRLCFYYHQKPAETASECPWCAEAVASGKDPVPRTPDWPADMVSREQADRIVAARLAAPPSSEPAPEKKTVDTSRWVKPKCLHRSLDVIDTRQCKTCTKTFDVEVYGCAVHGECTKEIVGSVHGAKMCQTCGDHVAAVDLGKIVVINLDRRPDRLEQFAARAWDAKLPTWERFAAIDGSEIPCPSEWQGGAGAYGCRQSHLRILENAIADKTPTLTVFEDDCGFVDGFMDRLQGFWSKLPHHWRALMLGCQEQKRPEPEYVAEGVKRTMNAQRTHAYVLRGTETMKTVYKVWSAAKTHIDHSNFLWQKEGIVYQPDPLLCFQAASKSDITGRDEPERAWGAE